MIAFFTGPLFTLVLFPLFGTALIAAAIRYLGWQRTNDRLVSAAASVGIIWVCALVIGLPGFPPPRDGGAMTLLLLAGLILGTLFDQFLPPFKDRTRLLELFLDLAVAFGIITWVLGQIDLWTVAVFVAWGIVLVRTRRFGDNSRLPATMALMSACGLALVARIGDSLIDRDIAIGAFSALIGLSVWLWFNRTLPLGFGYQWGGLSVLLLVGLRIVETNSTMAAPIAVLGFIFFADTAAVSLAQWKPGFSKLPLPVLVIVLSALPIILSSAIALTVMGVVH